MSNYGNANSGRTFGSSLQPRAEWDLTATMAHGVSMGTWIHEMGHGLFGIYDMYLYPRDRSGMNVFHTGSLDIMSKSGFKPMSAYSRVQGELAQPTPLISDDAVTDYVYHGQELTVGSCGDDANPCWLYDNTGPDYNIVQVPAIIDRETREVSLQSGRRTATWVNCRGLAL